MTEYLINSLVWSVVGFGSGWFTCRRWTRLEDKIDHIEQGVEELRYDDE